MSGLMAPQATASLSIWLKYLEQLHTSAIDLGLDRVKAVGQKADLLKPAPCVITVAGTNGKGSTCAMLEAILIEAGYKVGVYSSPHLVRYNERVRINNQELDDSEHTKAFASVEAARGDISLSLFEFGTLSALTLFKTHQVDVVVLEVGLGGRLDATNIVDHDVSVITSLAIDHVDWLGDNIDVIGYEKAGIFRSGKPAICGQPHPPATVPAHADDIGAELYQVGYQFEYQVEDNHWNWQCGAFDLTQLPLPNLPLPNAATALMALGAAELDISEENIINGLKKAQLPGRMQRVSEQPLIIMDVAHNPHSAEYFANQLGKIKQKEGKSKIHAVVAMLHDKDIASTIAAMKDIVDHWYPASLTGPRAATSEEILQYLPADCVGFDKPETAFDQALTQVQDDDMVIVFGSFYTVGQITSHLS
ncbi:bifunctional tetrahydrofolate synthase/dihydrofolate synthase [Photobacterium lucens]|uniref:bifunctional tetrahydrofolate synthase/dihydrofolate synthase n=1 Tax=Photobacterium lucens TaxID=2562949 RepID=UPI00136A9895|nr:bifunctional tetrahydrofolate synthase/dihydrofolate synthase [Photobacterium lucens]MBP2698852.1 bifunctional tetrahydrofolate synthase/dihydrofolate synthase [Vibrio parahaemolyticus]MZG55799.1 bifunctional tetrahydrofolate synthase/dihydrofolate synthase [Photobacterium lucens]MZG79393.1 bifunctional tetrahydrofolate synthase/dihydrofolate synthase [Photobacterium lucens]